VYNSCQNRRENELYRRIAERLNLVVTGGSDFHGTNKPGVDLGYLGEGVELDYGTVEALRARCAKPRGTGFKTGGRC
jgi:hypothetical protein